MARNNVFNNGKVYVMPSPCATCIFRPGNLMKLEDGRVDGMVADALANDSVIPCHHTIHGERDQNAVCHGYFARHKRDVTGLRAAVTFNMIEYVEPHEGEEDG